MSDISGLIDLTAKIVKEPLGSFSECASIPTTKIVKEPLGSFREYANIPNYYYSGNPKNYEASNDFDAVRDNNDVFS